MKKTIFLLIILISFGLMFGCNEIDNDPDGPGIVNSQYDQALTGDWEIEDTMSSGELNFDGQGNFTLIAISGGVEVASVTGDYTAKNNQIALTNGVATEGSFMDIIGTYTIEENVLTIDPDSNTFANLTLIKKGTNGNEETLMPPALPE
jgi:hypothetical protein